jgi:anti-sigma factor ChrR (cupin superfamily)
MNSKTGRHDQDHSDLVSLYVLQALPASEIPAVEAQIAACGDCARELDSLRPAIDSLVSWPADILRPSSSVWDRLAERVANKTDRQPPPAPASSEIEWEDAAPGISVKILSTDASKKQVTLLVRLAPGADYPPHRHAGIEELHLLDGELIVNDMKLYPGDYLKADAGSVDHRVRSETGCTCLLLTSTEDELL